MEYDGDQAQGLPIGSGLVEGSRKIAVGERLKASGMRWKRADTRGRPGHDWRH